MGKLIDGTTLEVISESGSQMICKCKVCGTSGIYNKKYTLENKQECRCCKKIKSLSDNPQINENAKIKILIKQEELAKQGAIKELKNGSKYVEMLDVNNYISAGDTISIVGYYGVIKNGKKSKPTHYVTLCSKCGALNTREINQKKGLKITYTCKLCSLVSKCVAECTKEFKEYAQKNEENKRNKQLMIENENRMRQRKKILELEDEIRKNNPDSFVNIVEENGRNIAVCMCKKCGQLIKRVNPTKQLKLKQCEGCKKAVKDKNYIGLYKSNMVGRCYNCMEIINQYIDPEKGYLCDIKCAMCKDADVIKGVFISDVVDRKYSHDCEYAAIDVKCDICGKYTEIKISDIVANKNGNIKKYLRCSKCGEPLNSESIEFETSTQDTRVSFNKAKVAADGKIIRTKLKASVNNNLFYDSIPIYSSNGEDYYRCICTTHGSKMTLSESEINNYRCEKCFDKNESLFKMLDPSNIKTKGNSKIY